MRRTRSFKKVLWGIFCSLTVASCHTGYFYTEIPLVIAQAHEEAHEESPTDTITTRILNLNIWGLPYGLADDFEKRLLRIEQTLPQYDLVLLQEAFDNRVERLRQLNTLPYQLHVNAGFFTPGSGLYILSRYPIVQKDFRAFTDCEGSDCLAQKGVVFARLQTPVGNIDVYTTHLQAGQSPQSQVTRNSSQLKTMQQLMRVHETGLPTILTGDFNLTTESHGYEKLTREMGLRDVYADAFPQSLSDPQSLAHATSSPENPYKALTHTARRVDYIFLKNTRTDLSSLSVDRIQRNGYGTSKAEVLSDHYGLSAIIMLKKHKHLK